MSTNIDKSSKLLEVKNLKTFFFTEEGVVKAVNDVSFEVGEGETLGLVGESGCGKSVTSLSIMKLIPNPPGKIISGQILFEGQDIINISENEMHNIRGNKISMIFQEPMTALNPVFTVGHQISEVFTLHQNISKKEAKEKTIELLKIVGIPEPEKRFNQYPFELSGGMRQRVMIAMALTCNPKLLIADEPTTALDVTIQAQILELIKEMQKKFNSAVILITHDLAVIAETVDYVAVMYAGVIVEKTEVKRLFKNPMHPYTIGLLNSIPILGQRGKELQEIPGRVPNLIDLPKGCYFADRCNKRMPICSQQECELKEVEPGHFVRCFLYN
ncbi:MAG: ABC transporter ATP-binding protein [Spirochaetales bacterium]|jgi:peptide/nickel transport system ATP-binding protein|nr:ABC transporter ATP-binding protein [Exilispira sp.]NMC67022.1 ABC transporter ATP-binding protein [Spirochaetales bacterium]